MHRELCRANGHSTTFERRYFALCFWLFRNYHNRTEDKDIAGVTATGCVLHLRSVLRGFMPLAHFTDVYILQRGCFSVCFSSKAVVGLEQQTGMGKHPRFFV